MPTKAFDLLGVTFVFGIDNDDDVSFSNYHIWKQ